MTMKNRLRNGLIRKVQKLPMEKLTEITNLLEKIENQVKSKEKTLALAGAWKDLNEEIFVELTDKLHINRANDRSYNSNHVTE
jgi:hypothetical protein